MDVYVKKAGRLRKIDQPPKKKLKLSSREMVGIAVKSAKLSRPRSRFESRHISITMN
jgi:hypothetical protein